MSFGPVTVSSKVAPCLTYGCPLVWFLEYVWVGLRCVVVCLFSAGLPSETKPCLCQKSTNHSDLESRLLLLLLSVMFARPTFFWNYCKSGRVKRNDVAFYRRISTGQLCFILPWQPGASIPPNLHTKLGAFPPPFPLGGALWAPPADLGGTRPPSAFWAEMKASGGISFNEFREK